MLAVATPVAAAGAGPDAGAVAHADSAPQVVSSRPASTFVDGVGVNVHFGYSSTSYGDTGRVLAALDDLRVRHVRDSLPTSANPALLSALRRLPAHGISATLALGQTNRGVRALPAPRLVFDELRRDGIRPDVDAVEPPNEWDMQGGEQWVEQISGWTRTFSGLLEKDPRWRDVTFVGPSTGRINRVSDLPDLGAFIDASNVHLYTGGGPPERDLDRLDEARAMAPGKPLWVTEMGFHTAVEQPGRQPAVTEAQQGSYLLRQLLENAQNGVQRSYIYELLEQRPEPALRNQERHFGLLRPDFSHKPAFDMLATLMRELDDEGTSAGPAVPPAPLDLTVATGGSDVQSLLFAKNDGSYRLVLWTRGDLEPNGTTSASDATVDVRIPGEARPLQVTRTSDGALAGDAAGSSNRVTGRLGGDPVIVTIGATGAKTAAAPARDVLRFDASSLTPEGATVPRGRVGQSSKWVILALASAFALAVAAAATIVTLWIRRRRQRP